MMRPLTPCVALVADGDPIIALDLDDNLRRLGVSVLGPVDNTGAALQLAHRQRPNIALLSASTFDGGVLPLATALEAMIVPFAVMTTGYERPLVSQEPVLRDAPRLTKPWDMAALHQITRGLYRYDLELKIAYADRRIAVGIRHVAAQIRRVEKFAATNSPQTALAESLLLELTRSLRLMRTSRALTAARLDKL